MTIPINGLPLTDLHSIWPGWTTKIRLDRLIEMATTVHTAEGHLLTLWCTDERQQENAFQLHLIFIFWQQGLLHVQCALSSTDPHYPDLSQLFPSAQRMQRAWFDLLGVRAEGAPDQRSWLRHGAWPVEVFPLRNDIALTSQSLNKGDHYSFIRVGGEGVHEIPVGPVHAGTIEPGHFRFQVVGERILRLEERLGYAHKGIAKQFQHRTFKEGAKLAGRISGDSTVAYAWAYSMAIEHLQQQNAPQRALWLRALLLERERIMNHLGDLGALGNDAGFSQGLTQFSCLKENMLRINEQIFGHRYLMDLIVPGGVARNFYSHDLTVLQQEIPILQKQIHILCSIYAKHNGLQDRFLTTGRVTKELAKKLGLIGFSARASGLSHDWRKDFSHAPYSQANFGKPCFETEGDVAARVSLRFREIDESWYLTEYLLKQLAIDNGSMQRQLPLLAQVGIGFGCVEGWRGPILIAVGNEDSQHIRWAHVHDPSWQNWPALEHAVIGDIVPDFPLINKSFNLSYSGHDL
jgi:Ni,Fe-hydrogenase III large subunit/Ni,Fe-hydrogenase III component G